MAVQTTYNETLSQAVAGQQGSTDHAEVISRTVETAALAFGKVAVQGAKDLGVRPPSASHTKFVGITVIDQAQAFTTADTYAVGQTAGVLREGPVWVAVGEAVAAGDAAYFVPATGAIMKTATDNIAIPGGRFDTSAASGGLALLHIA